MKLRLRGNSIRIRLMQKEVEDLMNAHSIDETVELASGSFCYKLVISDSFNAIFEVGHLVVSIPADVAEAWNSTDEVCIDHFLDLRGDKQLRILVEKDLKCNEIRPHEDDSDAFTYPNKSC